jgi:hypothetical protein
VRSLPSPTSHFLFANYSTNRRSIICCRRRKRRGEIYLEDDEDALFIVEKPFFLQPAPKTRYKSAVNPHSKYEDSGSDTEVEEFGYDSDAYEKV